MSCREGGFDPHENTLWHHRQVQHLLCFYGGTSDQQRQTEEQRNGRTMMDDRENGNMLTGEEL